MTEGERSHPTAPRNRLLATLENAMAYILVVRGSLEHETYSECLRLFTDLVSSEGHDQVQDQERITMELRDLLKDHPNLISGLRVFLPYGNENRDRSQENRGVLSSRNKVQQRDRPVTSHDNIHQNYQTDSVKDDNTTHAITEDGQQKNDLKQNEQKMHNSGGRGERLLNRENLLHNLHQHPRAKRSTISRKPRSNYLVQGNPREQSQQGPPTLRKFHLGEEALKKHARINKCSNKGQYYDKQLEKEKEQNKEKDQERDRNKNSEYNTLSISSLLQNCQKHFPRSEMSNKNKPVSVQVSCSSEPNSKELLVNHSQQRSFSGGSNMIESVTDTIKHIENLLGKIQDNTIKVDGHFQIEEHLTDLNFRCIQHVYDDYASRLLNGLSKNPRHILLVLKKRLRQRQAELLKEAQHL